VRPRTLPVDPQLAASSPSENSKRSSAAVEKAQAAVEKQPFGKDAHLKQLRSSAPPAKGVAVCSVGSVDFRLQLS